MAYKDLTIMAKSECEAINTLNKFTGGTKKYKVKKKCCMIKPTKNND